MSNLLRALAEELTRIPYRQSKIPQSHTRLCMSYRITFRRGRGTTEPNGSSLLPSTRETEQRGLSPNTARSRRRH